MLQFVIWFQNVHHRGSALITSASYGLGGQKGVTGPQLAPTVESRLRGLTWPNQMTSRPWFNTLWIMVMVVSIVTMILDNIVSPKCIF